MTASDIVKELADGFIASIYPDAIPPRQAIEVRLAFYGGMMAMIGRSAQIASEERSEEDAMQEMANTYTAIQERALKLNQERAKA